MTTLTNARYISLATWRKSGKEVRTPIWFAAESDERLYCFSASNAGKVKRIRRDGQAKIAVCDVRGQNIEAWYGCTAHLIADKTEMDRAYFLLRQKYGMQMLITNFFSMITGRIKHRTVIRLDLSSESKPGED